MQPPVLETARLTLTAHTVDDFASIAQRWGDPAVVRHIGPPSSARDSWLRLLQMRGLWALCGFGYWAVREKGSDRCIGDVGFGDLHRDIDPDIDGLPEAGWVLSREVHGKGYAVEAMQAALAWLERTLPCDRAVCLVDPANLPSRKVADRLGFAAPLPVRYKGEEVLLLTRLLARSPGR